MTTISLDHLKLTFPDDCSLEDLVRQICLKSKESFYVCDGLRVYHLKADSKIPARVRLAFADENSQEYHYRDVLNESLYAVFGQKGKEMFDQHTEKVVFIPKLTKDQIS